MKELNCDYCGQKTEKYESEIKENNFCSRECSISSQKNRENLECAECGKTFERAESLVKETNFCSKNCWEKSLENNLKTVSCDECSEEFEVYPTRYKNKNLLFCCKECEGKYWSKNRSGEDSPLYERHSENCSNCGKEIKIIKHDKEKFNHHFCSKQCEKETSIHKPKGEDHHAWKDKVKTYPQKFYDKREEVVKRDGQCMRCGVKRKKHFEKYGRDIFVHHIDGDKENNDEKNLITMCHKCNCQVEYLEERPSRQEIIKTEA